MLNTPSVMSSDRRCGARLSKTCRELIERPFEFLDKIEDLPAAGSTDAAPQKVA
jgi:hypothetical protein